MAVLTQPLNGRRAQPYHDMDFWSNPGDSVYRAAVGVRELQAYRNFRYCPGQFVTEFREDREQVTVRASESFAASRLVVAAGALGTTRIVLRSLKQYDTPVPLTCNAHTYIPCLLPGRLGKPAAARCHSLAQLTMIYDPTGDREHLVQGQLYSYGSLMLFRLLKESPLPLREGLRVMQALMPALAIWVVQHEDERSSEKYCQLRRVDGADRLEIVYRTSATENETQSRCEKRLARLLRQLGCWAFKRVHPGHGSSVHYASQFPITATDRPLTTELSGRLRGTRHVYLADGATHGYLPAKGLTFTMMANANRVGTHVLQSLS